VPKQKQQSKQKPHGRRAFNWEKGIMWHRVDQRDTERFDMPHEFTLAGGVHVIRRDTGERVRKPISYTEAVCGALVYEDGFLGERIVETVRCDVVPGGAVRS
jgi:hypothetical protein